MLLHLGSNHGCGDLLQVWHRNQASSTFTAKCRMMRPCNSLIECGLRLDPALRHIQSLTSLDIQVLGEVSLLPRAFGGPVSSRKNLTEQSVINMCMAHRPVQIAAVQSKRPSARTNAPKDSLASGASRLAKQACIGRIALTSTSDDTHATCSDAGKHGSVGRHSACRSAPRSSQSEKDSEPAKIDSKSLSSEPRKRR